MKKYSFPLTEKIMGKISLTRMWQRIRPRLVICYVNEWMEAEIEYGGVSRKFYFKRGGLNEYEIKEAFKETFWNRRINGHSYIRPETLIRRGDIVFDCGACEGFFAWLALIMGAKKVYLFEPSNILCEGLEKTFRWEIENEIVVIVKKALSDKSEKRNLVIDKDMYCSSSIDDKWKTDSLNTITEEIETTSIDEFVKENEIHKLDIVKMDIENEEVKAVKGALDTIDKLSPKCLVATYHSYENSQLIKKIILERVPTLKVAFRGYYCYEKPARPFLTLVYK